MSLKFMEMVADINSRRYLRQMQNLAISKVPCGFFCGFNITEKLLRLIQWLKNSRINLTCIVVPNDETKKVFADIAESIYTLNDIANGKANVNYVFYENNFFYDSFTNFFRRYGMKAFPIADLGGMESTFNFYIQHLPELYSVYEMFADEESKAVYRAFITGRVTGQNSDFRFAPESQYFLEGFLPSEGDIAIDGGAYDGATSRDFTMQGAKVYAFEMSAQNYPQCLARAQKYNFVIENIGLSNREGTDTYKDYGVGASKGGGTETGNFIDLDTYVLRKNLPRVDYIKLDIEGAELDMLHGAAKTISRWKPKMAISAYHKPEDLWTLANYVKSLRSDYEFKFRHYKIDATDYLFGNSEREILKIFGLDYFVPSACESVLYCR